MATISTTSLPIGLTAALLVSPVGWIYYHFLFVGPSRSLSRSMQRWCGERPARAACFSCALPFHFSSLPGCLRPVNRTGFFR